VLLVVLPLVVIIVLGVNLLEVAWKQQRALGGVSFAVIAALVGFLFAIRGVLRDGPV
jgi:hypothetical protein